MNQTGYSSNGPKCFSTSKRTSFVDIRDDDIPGPGSHNSSRIDRNTPTKWKFGTSTQRDTFLQKYPRPNPAPTQYQPNPAPTMNTSAIFSFPKSEIQNPACYQQDQNCRVDYHPNSNINKNQLPNYSFGYNFQRDYSTKVPAPNIYEINSKTKSRIQFNKTQSFFTSADRPLPYGDWGSNPGIGQYQLNSKDPLYATAHEFSKSPKLLDNKFQGVIPIKFYDLAKQMKQPGKGFTMRPFYEGIKNKDVQIFPAPNHYNPKQLESKKKIINYTSQRTQLYGKDLVKFPSPQKYVTSPEFYKKRKSLSFTKQLRPDIKPTQGPGPAKYNVQKKLNDQKGYIGRKIKNFSEFITPAGSDYNPIDHLTKSTPQRVINYQTNRVNFSKSITGIVGPGDYLKDKQVRGELGKISKSMKFQKNKNKNPGPGFYQIPSSIGKLPKYYSGKKKLTVDGFSTFALDITQKTKRHQQWLEQQQREKQKQQTLRRQAQQNQQKKQ